MALHTIYGEPVQHGPGRGNTIDHRDGAELFVVGSTFLVVGGLPVEGSCDAIIKSRVREQVAGQLRGNKLVVGNVSVESLNDPVAIGPHPGTTAIRLIS